MRELTPNDFPELEGIPNDIVHAESLRFDYYNNIKHQENLNDIEMAHHFDLHSIGEIHGMRNALKRAEMVLFAETNANYLCNVMYGTIFSAAVKKLASTILTEEELDNYYSKINDEELEL